MINVQIEDGDAAFLEFALKIAQRDLARLRIEGMDRIKRALELAVNS
jgi:hypothetical protein